MHPEHRGTPTAPDTERAAWALKVQIEADHRKYEDRKVISADDIMNLRIILGTSKDVRDVINA